MRIAVCGVNGFIGTHLSRGLVRGGYEVIRVGREHFLNTEWLAKSIEGCDVVINLCGEPVMKKWDEMYKHKLYVSRVETTNKIIKTIESLKQKPKLFISVSSVSIYQEDEVHEDNSRNFSTSYLALLAKEWEHEAKRVEILGVRSVIFRLGTVLGKDGGVIKEMQKAFGMGVGAIPGNGKQPFSWVHVEDVIEVFKKAIKQEKMSGIYNLVAPESVTMQTFIKTFAKINRKKVVLKVPESVLKIKYAEGAETLLTGSFVVSTKLEKEGYSFKYGNLNEALDSIWEIL